MLADLAVAVSPPKANAAVLLDPALAPCCLVVFKSATSVHEVPFQDSAFACSIFPGGP